MSPRPKARLALAIAGIAVIRKPCRAALDVTAHVDSKARNEGVTEQPAFEASLTEPKEVLLVPFQHHQSPALATG